MVDGYIIIGNWQIYLELQVTLHVNTTIVAGEYNYRSVHVSLPQGHHKMTNIPMQLSGKRRHNPTQQYIR